MQRVALQLACGIDMDEAQNASAGQRAAISARLARAVRRERQKGLAGHWSYDLNRHIALAQALSRFQTQEGAGLSTDAPNSS